MTLTSCLPSHPEDSACTVCNPLLLWRLLVWVAGACGACRVACLGRACFRRSWCRLLLCGLVLLPENALKAADARKFGGCVSRSPEVICQSQALAVSGAEVSDWRKARVRSKSLEQDVNDRGWQTFGQTFGQVEP